MHFELHFVLHYLLLRRKQRAVSWMTILSITGISMSVATLVIVSSIMNGFHNQLIDYMIRLSGHITISSHHRHFDLSILPELEAVPSLPHVASFMPTLQEDTVLLSARGVSGIRLIGTTPDNIANTDFVDQTFEDGTLFSGNFIALGRHLAHALGVSVGETVTLLAPDALVTIFGAIPNTRDYQVSDVFTTGIHEYDRNTAYMDLHTMQAFYELPATMVNHIAIRVDHNQALAPVRHSIEHLLSGSADPLLYIRTWEQNNSQMVRALDMEKYSMSMVLSLIIVLASFSMMSTILLMAQSKKNMIAILKTFGASNQSIFLIFLIFGLYISILGTGIGTALGLFIASNIVTLRQFLEQTPYSSSNLVYFLDSLPVHILYSEVILVASFSLILSLLAAIFPAIQTTRLEPTEILREIT